jgi:excisionase family DNA binding protein
MQAYLTIKEVAARLRLSEITVYRMLWDGEIPSYKVRHRRLVSEQALANYLVERGTIDNALRHA